MAETPVLVQGNLLAGTDGVRLNVRECYPLDAAVTACVRKITWLLRPDHPETPAFLRALRAAVEANLGDTRLEFAFVFEDRIAAVAEVSGGLSWRAGPGAIPAIAGPPRRRRRAGPGQAPATPGESAVGQARLRMTGAAAPLR